MQIFSDSQNTDTTVDIDGVLEAFLARKLDESAKVSPHYHALWQEVARLFRSGGKRLRSRIVLLSYLMFGGKNIDAILPAAAAQELLHLAMLIHDDIIDRDYIRYGTDNIAGRYKRHYDTYVKDGGERTHYAQSAALLAGDLLISEAYLLLTESSVEPQKILEVQKLLGQGIFEVIGGELLDTESAFRDKESIPSSLVAVYKTASYSFTMPLLIGAQLAGASLEDQVHLRVIGRNLGIAYQIRDDLIGVFGDTAITGKTTSGDIREGKRTYLIEQFEALADEQQRATFERYFGRNDISEDEVGHVRQVLIESGARDAAEQAIATYEATVKGALEQMTIESEYVEQFEILIATAMKRVK